MRYGSPGRDPSRGIRDILLMADGEHYLAEPRKSLSERNIGGEVEAMIRSLEESGELRHLHGKPLDLSDDSPNWFIARALKRNGFSHPLLERAREVDAAEAEADGFLDRLRERRSRQEDSGTPDAAGAFNDALPHLLNDYRRTLEALHTAIRVFNLAAP